MKPFKKLVLIYHPDKNQDSDICDSITKILNTLKDEKELMDTIFDMSKTLDNDPEKMLNYLLNMNKESADMVYEDARSVYERWKSMSPAERWKVYRDQFVAETEKSSAKNKGTYEIYKQKREELFKKTK